MQPARCHLELATICLQIFMLGYKKNTWVILTYAHVTAGTCLCVCMCVHVESRGQPQVSFLKAPLSTFCLSLCFEIGSYYTALAALELST